MWTWVPIFLLASFRAWPLGASSWPVAQSASLAAALVIGIGATSCIGTGLLADRLGRTTTTAVAMIVSAASALATGFLFGHTPGRRRRNHLGRCHYCRLRPVFDRDQRARGAGKGGQRQGAADVARLPLDRSQHSVASVRPSDWCLGAGFLSPRGWTRVRNACDAPVTPPAGGVQSRQRPSVDRQRRVTGEVAS